MCLPAPLRDAQSSYRPLSSGFVDADEQRLKAAGIRCRSRGPHALRHALRHAPVTQGASLKEIGDLLGHRGLESVGIYAKVDVPALRAVAAVDLGGLA